MKNLLSIDVEGVTMGPVWVSWVYILMFDQSLLI